MADAAQCRARGVGLSIASTSTDSCFYIAAASEQGMALSKGGDDVEVIFTSPCRVEGTIIDNGEGFYEVTYRPLPSDGEGNPETLWVTRLPVLRRRSGRLEYRHRNGSEGWAVDTFELKAGVLTGASSGLRIELRGCTVCADDKREMEREQGTSYFRLQSERGTTEFKAGSAVSQAQWVSVLRRASREQLFKGGLHKVGGSEGSSGEPKAVHTPVTCPTDQTRGLFLHICIKVNGRQMDGSPWHFTLTPGNEPTVPIQTPTVAAQVPPPPPLDEVSVEPEQSGAHAGSEGPTAYPPPYHGVLHKWSMSQGQWRRRFFVLVSDPPMRLLHFLKPLHDVSQWQAQEARALGCLYLDKAGVLVDRTDLGPSGVGVVTLSTCEAAVEANGVPASAPPREVMRLSADDADTLTAWVKALSGSANVIEAVPSGNLPTPPVHCAAIGPPGPPAAFPALAASDGSYGTSAVVDSPAAHEASPCSLRCTQAPVRHASHQDTTEAIKVVLVPIPAASASKAIAQRCVEQQLSHILHFLYTHHDQCTGAPGGASSSDGTMHVDLVASLESWLHAGPHDGASLEQVLSGLQTTYVAANRGSTQGVPPVLGSLLYMLRHLRRLQDAVELGTDAGAPPSPAGSPLLSSGLNVLSAPRSAVGTPLPRQGVFHTQTPSGPAINLIAQATRGSDTGTTRGVASAAYHMSSSFQHLSLNAQSMAPAGHPMQQPRRLKTRPLGPRPEWQRPTAKDRPLAGPTPRSEVVRSLLQQRSAASTGDDGVAGPGTPAAGATSRLASKTRTAGHSGEEGGPSKYGNIYSCLLSHQAREQADAHATASSCPSCGVPGQRGRARAARGRKDGVREVAVQTEGAGRQECSDTEGDEGRRLQAGPWSPASSDRSAFSSRHTTPGRCSTSRQGSRGETDAAGTPQITRRTPARERWRDAFEPRQHTASTSVTPDRPKAPCYLDLYSPPRSDAEVAASAEEQRLCDWLAGLGMQHLAPVFLQQGLARLSNLELLDEEDLLELGVRQQVDRRALLTAIHDFSQRTKHYTRHALRDGQRKRPMPQLEPRLAQGGTKAAPPAAAIKEEPTSSPASAEALLRAFDDRDYVTLLADFTRLLSPAAREAGHPLCSVTGTLEFYLHLYAATGEMQDGQEHAGEALDLFRRYLVSQPSVAESPSLCGFASLPEVEDPRQHPTFAPLFDPEWAAALRERLRLYLHIVVAAPQASPVAPLPLPPPAAAVEETTAPPNILVASPSSPASCYGQPSARQRPSRRAPPVPIL